GGAAAVASGGAPAQQGRRAPGPAAGITATGAIATGTTAAGKTHVAGGGAGSGVVTTAGAAARPPEPLLRRRAVGGGPREPSRRYRGAALHRGARHGRTGTYGGRVTGPGARGGRMRGPEGSHVLGGPAAHAAESVPHAAAATGSRAVGHVLCTTITLDLLTRPRPGRFC